MVYVSMWFVYLKVHANNLFRIHVMGKLINSMKVSYTCTFKFLLLNFTYADEFR